MTTGRSAPVILGAPLSAWIADGNPARVRRAADIPDGIFLDAVRAASRITRQAAVNRWQVGAVLDGNADTVRPYEMPDTAPVIPGKIVLAKARRIESRPGSLLDGCTCGCRGDWSARPSPGFAEEDDMTRAVKFDFREARPSRPATAADYDRIRTLFSRGTP